MQAKLSWIFAQKLILQVEHWQAYSFHLEATWSCSYLQLPVHERHFNSLIFSLELLPYVNPKFSSLKEKPVSKFPYNWHTRWKWFPSHWLMWIQRRWFHKNSFKSTRNSFSTKSMFECFKQFNDAIGSVITRKTENEVSVR